MDLANINKLLSGYNPESSDNGLSTRTRGIDFNSYPLVTSYHAGINISF